MSAASWLPRGSATVGGAAAVSTEMESCSSGEMRIWVLYPGTSPSFSRSQYEGEVEVSCISHGLAMPVDPSTLAKRCIIHSDAVVDEMTVEGKPPQPMVLKISWLRALAEANI